MKAKEMLKSQLPYLAALLACIGGFGFAKATDHVNASEDAKRLQEEASVTMCECSRAAINHILNSSKKSPMHHGIPNEMVNTFKHMSEALANTPCDGKEGAKLKILLDEILDSSDLDSPLHTDSYETKPSLQEEAEAFDALGDIEFLNEVGVENMDKNSRTVSHASMRLLRDQRKVMRTFLQRPQSRR